jgi:hypothetical protein
MRFRRLPIGLVVVFGFLALALREIARVGGG